MRNKDYEVPYHVRIYVKRELEDYKGNKRLLKKLQDLNASDRELLIVTLRIAQIERVMENLSKEDREAAEIIFFLHYSQERAELEKGISKAAYYRTKKKIIYITAREMELI